MKLLGKDLPLKHWTAEIEAVLKQRGLLRETLMTELKEPEPTEMRVDPHAFNLAALEEHSDCTRPLKFQSHRKGFGKVLVSAKRLFRQSFQILINETLGRQRLFNGHVRDSYAQLASEVIRLRTEMDALKKRRG